VGTGTAPDAPDHEALHTVGRPRPGIGIQVRGTDDVPLPHGEVGAVWIRSDASMAGYWRNPEATADALVDGWLRTGDLGFTDASGLLTLAGRQGEMFIRGGYNVFPSEVSGVLASHPDVADVVLIPRPDDVLGEIGVAVVVPADPGAPPSLDSLRAHAQDSLAHHKLPEDLVLVDEIPLTAMQKVDRRRLSALVQEPDPPDAPI
jgi:acyl-CoA synthetase (AMP-forming)/AMP-acid ligase II